MVSRRRVLAGAAIFAATPFAAWAQEAPPVAPADAAAICAVIEQQLKAFLADDAAGAYSHAAPMIREMFRDQGAFMEMVKRGYQPVYRPREFTFGELKTGQLGLTQTVRIVDEMGEAWNAIYRMEKQPDGSWKISGVWLFKLPQIGV